MKRSRRDDITIKSAKNDQPTPTRIVRVGADSRSDYSKLEPLVWTPETRTAFKVLLSARLCAAVWSQISDCDETYNFWEPTHYLMYGKGMQTWEYSPTFAIRSYAYLWLYALPGLVYSSLLQNQRMLVFYFMRCVVAFVEVACEVYFYGAVRRKFGEHISKMYLLLSIFSAGMFISSCAFLPSSFAMKLLMVSYAAWWTGKDFFAVFSTAFSAIVGWPFSGALGIPIFIEMVLVRRSLLKFIQCLVMSVGLVLPLVTLVDSFYYGKLVVASVNIVLYNLFGSHGPNLYGTEPFDFYLKNGLVNFNFAFLLAFCALPLLIVTQWCGVPTERLRCTPLLGMYIWFAIFFLQPHKEERFLFPVYPLVILNAAVSIDLLQRWLHRVAFKANVKHHLDLSELWWLLPVMMSGFLGVSRSLLLYKAYNAPMAVAMHLNYVANPGNVDDSLLPTRTINLCVGKEWHRFPSSFFLPNRWQLEFIKSEFRGQLPKKFIDGHLATRVIPTDMNDANVEEPSRYISLTKCDYLIDSERRDISLREPNFTKHPDFSVIYSVDFMDISNTPAVARILYIPFLWEARAVLVKYNLLKNTKLGKITNGRDR